MSLAQRILDGAGEGFTDYAGDLLAPLVRALVADAEPVDTLVGGEDGWSLAFNLDTTPVPGWLGQLAGVAAMAGTLAQQRARVRARGYSRGTVAALRAAAQSVLTGTRVVRLRERDGDPYAVGVVTFLAQTPDPAAVLAAVRAVLPAGLRLTHTVLTGQTWRELANTGQTWGDLRTQTWDAVRYAVPPA